MSTKIKPPRWVVGWIVIGTIVHLATAADFFEDFESPPAESHWRVHGDQSLFQWNAAGHLDVTWDSSRTNSYFHRPLGTILGKDDDFSLEFELTLTSIEPGFREGKSGTFEIAIGFINLADATDTNFFRGAGTGTVRNVVELDYFPDNGLGATFWPAVWSTNAILSYRDGNDYTLIELPENQVLRVLLTYTANNRTFESAIVANGQPVGPINDLVLAPTFSDFRVDTFAICSYSDEPTSGSILATGRIDNLRLTIPPPPVDDLRLVQNGNAWELHFGSRTNWFYQAEWTSHFDDWQSLGEPTPGNGETALLPVNVAGALSFWRINATRP